MLKADLHLHTSEDIEDSYIEYSTKELIDEAKKKGFAVLSITLHNKLLYTPELVKYAKERGILLIPGIEKSIEGAHVLLYNFTQEEIDKIKVLEDLRKIKKKHHLVIAPHPYLRGYKNLGWMLKEYVDVFDAVEFSFCYSKIVNINWRAKSFAKKHKKTFIANSDTHFMVHFGGHYTEIDAEKNIDSVIKAIKEGKVVNHSHRLSNIEVLRIVIAHITRGKIKC